MSFYIANITIIDNEVFYFIFTGKVVGQNSSLGCLMSKLFKSIADETGGIFLLIY
jgi:hypothetical protein